MAANGISTLASKADRLAAKLALATTNRTADGRTNILTTTDLPATWTTITAGAFVTDDIYYILTIGTTDFTLIGASANIIGTKFTATGIGAGTGTADTSLDNPNAGGLVQGRPWS